MLNSITQFVLPDPVPLETFVIIQNNNSLAESITSFCRPDWLHSNRRNFKQIALLSSEPIIGSWLESVYGCPNVTGLQVSRFRRLMQSVTMTWQTRRRRCHASDVPVIPVVPAASITSHTLRISSSITRWSPWWVPYSVAYEHAIRVCGVSFQIFWSGKGAQTPAVVAWSNLNRSASWRTGF